MHDAVALFDRVIDLDPVHAHAYDGRAFAHLCLGRGEKAANDARTYLALCGWRAKYDSGNDRSMWSVITAHFGYRQAWRDTEARAVLDQAAVRCDVTAWPYPIIQYLRREISADALYKFGTTHDRMVELQTHIGLDLALSGQRDDALVHLNWVAAHGKKSKVLERHLAPLLIVRIVREDQTCATVPSLPRDLPVIPDVP